MIFGKSSYLLAAFLIFFSLSKYQILFSLRNLSLTSIFLITVFFLSLSTVLEFYDASSGGYIGHLIFNYSSSYIGLFGTFVASLLILSYSYFHYFGISVNNVYRNILKITSYIYLKSKYKIKMAYDQLSLKIKLSRQKKK